MKSEENLEDRIATLERELNRIHKLYEKAVLYQSADPEISLSQARKSAEAVCKNIYIREGLEEDGKPVAKMMLNDLISILTRSGILPAHISVSLGTIQAFGNFGTHDQGDESEFITVEYIKPCLQALNTVVHWYFMRYSQEGLLYGRDRSPAAQEVLVGNERLYFDSFEMAFADGVVDGQERVLLDRRREDLGISLERVRTIENIVKSRHQATPGEQPHPLDPDDEDSIGEGDNALELDGWLSIVSKRTVPLPAGIFQMGSENGAENEKPTHEVALSGFSMAKCPVTQRDFEKICGINPSNFAGDPNRPVESVSWFDAIKFCNRLSKADKLVPVYSIAEEGIVANFRNNGYSLPTEAEWEYACRAGSPADFYWGDNEKEAGLHAWCDSNSDDTTHTVGTKRKNAFGLFDMVGNVWEWTNDFFNQEYYGTSDRTDPLGPEFGEYRVLRGGCWFNGQNRLRSSCRLKRLPNLVDDVTGFRFVARHPGLWSE